jgi:hypothetical protein
LKESDIAPYVMRKSGMSVESGKRRARFWLEGLIEKGTLKQTVGKLP